MALRAITLLRATTMARRRGEPLTAELALGDGDVPRNLRRSQRHHPHPEHRFVADVDIVFAHEGQLAVIAQPEHRQAGGKRFDRIAVPHLHREIVLRDQHASARVDMESARVNFLGFDVLDRCGLAGGLIDRIHHDAVFTAFEDLLALILARRLRPICPVHETAVRMDVDRACRLPALILFGSASVSARKAISGLILPFSTRNMYILFWVSIDAYIQGLVG